MIKIKKQDILEITDQVQLNVLSRNDKALICTVYEKTGVAGNTKKLMGYLSVYFDESPISEDTRPHWTMQFFAYPDYQKKEYADCIINYFLDEKIIYEPVLIYITKLIKTEIGQGIIIQKGKIYPEDEQVYSKT